MTNNKKTRNSTGASGQSNSDLFQLYLNDIRHIPLLSKEQEAEYATRAKNGDQEGRRIMIESNLRLVINIAKRYQHPRLHLAELTAEGNLGLIHALDKFDPSKGFRFSTYATWWIKHYIESYLIYQNKAVRLPIDAAKELKKALIYLHKHHAGEPLKATTIDSLALHLARSPAYVVHLLSQHQDVVSLNQGHGESDTLSLINTLAIEKKYKPCAIVASEHFNQFMQHILVQLPERERFIIEQRFHSDERPTLEELGQQIGLTRERTRQLEKLALNKLKVLLLQQNLNFDDFKTTFDSEERI